MDNAALSPIFIEARKRFHAALLQSVLRTSASGIPSNADGDSKASVAIAKGILDLLGTETTGKRLAGQTSGRKFETLCEAFLNETFGELGHLRPGRWEVKCIGARSAATIAQFEQYSHLIALQVAAKRDRALAAALQSDYTITPDIVIARAPEDDAAINAAKILVGDSVATRASLRQSYNSHPILHASISCKWTLRSDRAQNARSEALNLIRNRKGRLPHIGVVIGEPLPSRIASLALGTGDIDCVYHFALYELYQTIESSSYEDAKELLDIMIDGKRLKDISDLPLDLAV
ncbi:MAG TPA: NgoMIV family type II restriction endonuclease [Chthonomonadaceae bacterium]|nr:NgoMIV family type II restriction endonuclease [Chthonomonadaceae bacterium]